MRDFARRFGLAPLAVAAAYLIIVFTAASLLPAPPEALPASPLPDWWLWAAALIGLLLTHLVVVLPLLALARRASSRVLRQLLPFLPALAATVTVALAFTRRGEPWYSGWSLGIALLLAGVPLALSGWLTARRAHPRGEDASRAA